MGGNKNGNKNGNKGGNKGGNNKGKGTNVRSSKTQATSKNATKQLSPVKNKKQLTNVYSSFI